MRTLEGRAERRIAAPCERCLHVAADIARWPEWASTVRSVEGAGAGSLVEARLLGIPLVLLAAVDAQRDRVTVRRLPFDANDRERFELTFQVTADGPARCSATAVISAQVAVPRLLPVPGAVPDQVAARLLGDLDRRATGEGAATR